MTTPNHGIMSGLILYPAVRFALWHPNWQYNVAGWFYMALAIYFGIRPDVEKFFYGEKAGEYGGKYHELHQLTLKNLLVPFQNLHIVLDWITHDHKKGGWLFIAYIYEVLLWVIYFFIISDIVRCLL